MLRTITTTALSVIALSTAVSAMEAQDLDINGDNFASIAEVRQIFPGFRSSDFRDLDTNDDRRLSNNELQVAGAQAIIGKYEATQAVVHGLSDVDANGDRFASKGELTAVYPGLLDSEFRQIDTNRDQRVSASELYAPLAQALVTRYEMGGDVVVTIMQVDTNDDFFASFEELSQSFPGLSHVDFEMIDANGDNRVSSTEYYQSDAQAIFDRN